jgi:Zn-dependent protease with chaperone function
MRIVRTVAVLLFCLTSLAAVAAPPPSAMPAVIPVPAAAQPSAHFDPQAATEAYLALIPPDAKARSDAYFEGGYWLLLWELLYGAVVALLILNLRWSAAMRDLAERITRFGPLRTAIYWAEYMLLTFALGFPLAYYEGYVREHKYGLATQTFGPWMRDQLMALLVDAILGAIITMLLFGIVRKLQRNWWIWGALVTALFLVFVQIIGPVYISPLFNKITRLNDPKITEPILRLARANGIPAHDVYQSDASKQTTRMSANVSGFGHTMRITLNDNLLRRGSPEEIQAVMGHEMGHYVLNHVYKGLMQFLILIVFWFAALNWSLERALARWGERWQIRGIGDTAILPLVILVSSIFFFILTPVVNTIIRVQESEADMYGLNASREPDGFARAAIHLGEYRKMSPGPVEEWIFFDHPSGRTRINAAMRWKGENLNLPATR